MFKQTARLWSHVYAGAPVSSPEYTRKIEKLCAMGFEKNAVIVALSSKSWDVETATELLLSNWISRPFSSFPWSLSSLLLTHTHHLSSKFPDILSHLFPCWTLCFTVESSPPRSLPSFIPFVWHLSSLLIISAVPHSSQSLCELLSLVSFGSFYVFLSVTIRSFICISPPSEANAGLKTLPTPDSWVQEAAVSSLSLPMQCISF